MSRFLRLSAGMLMLAFTTGPTRYQIPVIPAIRGDACENGYVGLTFDDGPNINTRAAILEVLRSAKARATFFEIGINARKHPELVRATLQAGMWIGNHTLTHPHLAKVDSNAVFAEIASTQFVLQQITGRAPELIRPPFGETNEQVRKEIDGAKLLEVLWKVDSRDWAGSTAEGIRAGAATLENGEIILMHDGFQTTLDALPLIIGDLSSRGLCPGRIVFTPRDISGVGTVFHAIAVKP